MAKKRLTFAEKQRERRLNELHAVRLEKERRAAAAQAQRAAESARIAAERASEQDRKRLEREAELARVAAKEAEVEELNNALADTYAQLDGLLTATLDVDDFVDLEDLRVVVEHPPFPREDLRTASPTPPPIADPPEPEHPEVTPPSGLFGRKKKLAEAQAAADAQYAKDYAAWQEKLANLPAQRASQAEEYAAIERKREEKLARELAQYQKECVEREREAEKNNTALDELIAGLGYGTPNAVQEYVGIVLANSVYPEFFPVTHSANFDSQTAELKLRVTIPGPEKIPVIKAYKYVKKTDEITSVTLAQKDIKDRYTNIVNSIALRSLHEIFEADRRGLIQAISLKLDTKTIDPATGRHTYVPFIAVATSREHFAQIDLSAVVPAATLAHLGAAVSKNPYALIPATGEGVRSV